jgi:ATP-dependent helicase/nuclease subunit A
MGDRRAVPLPSLRKEEKAAPVREAEEEVAKEEREEHWRLLYVAMTRAEEALFIVGALRKKQAEVPPESWYAMLEPLFGADEWMPDALWDGRKQLGALSPVPDAEVRQAEPATDLPDVLTVPIGPEPRPPRPLAPSSLGEDEAPDPPVRPGPGAVLAAQRGTLLHKLFERLPQTASDAESHVGAMIWLARNAPALSVAEHEEIVATALSVLADPQWADVFGPASLAEVPLAALVEGRMIVGTIDRLVIGLEVIRIVDFKTARRPPRSLAEIPAAYVRQMAAYVQAMAVIHPGRRVEAALLYTQTPELFVLPPELLAAQKLGLGVAQ